MLEIRSISMEWSVERSRIKLGTIPQNSKVSTLTLSKYGEGNFENYKLIATTMNFVFFLKKKIINYWGKFLSILFPWWFINDYIYLPNIEISINWFDMKEGIKRVPWNRVLYYTRFEPRIFSGHILQVERGSGDISHSTYVMMEKWPYMCFSSPCYRKS